MPYIQIAKGSLAEPLQLYYEDSLQGKPVVFIHGWPLSQEMWEYQFNELPKQGIRCISYDRRGFGKSDKPFSGYDYDTLAADLKAVLDELNLDRVTLVGFSMGGGEVARYIGRYGSSRIEKIILISSVVPYMLKTADNPDGIEPETFDGFADKLKADRPAFLSGFGKIFYGVHFLSNPVSQEFLDWNLSLAMQGSPKATLDCLHSFSETDFRNDLIKFDVPTLIIHGDADKTVPIEISSKKAANLIPGAIFKVYEGSPHGLFYTDRETLNLDLVDFINTSHLQDRKPVIDLDEVISPLPYPSI